MVVGVTEGNYKRYSVWRRFREVVLAAVIESAVAPKR